MKKRNLFAEINEGFEALKLEREGKMTLRKHIIEAKPAQDAVDTTQPNEQTIAFERGNLVLRDIDF